MMHTPKTVVQIERKVVLPRIRWQTYEAILRDVGDTSAVRFFYDRGMLEIFHPSQAHEEMRVSLTSLAEHVAMEWRINFRNLGSTTFKNESLNAGFEPAVCFYVQRLAGIATKETFDFPDDPAPDLVIEVDITSPSLERLPLYGKFGVREVWRTNATGAVTIHRFDDLGTPTDEAESMVITGLTPAQITTFLTQSTTLSRRDWIASVRDWARANPPV